MKRTFLKVALLSTVLLGMPAAFTSCKDYQDDIDNLNAQQQALQNQLKDLEAALAQAKADCAASCQNALNAANEAKKEAELAKQAAAQAKAEAIQEAIDQCKKLMEGTASKADIADLASKIDGIQKGLNSLSTDVDGIKSDLAQLKIQLAALENFKSLTGYDTVAAAISALQTSINTINSKLDALTTTDNLEAAKQELKQYCDNAIKQANVAVSQISANLVTLLTTQLRSLVFIPDLYVDGIEATTYTYLQYHAKVTAAGALTTNNHNGVASTVTSPATDWNYSASTAWTEIDPVNYVNYELNPSTALVTADDLTFLAADKENITRATVNPVKDQVTVAGGNVKVGYTVKGSLILPAPKVSVFALNAKVPNLEVDGKTTEVGDITSDYAALYGSVLTPVALAYNTTTVTAVTCPTDPELYPTLKQAIENAPTLEVQWDKSLDLKTYLETHYTINNGTAHSVFTPQELTDYNLTYDFAPIQYTIGSNQTSDSQFIQQNLASGVVTPCGVTDAGVANNTATKASIDKNPIVRVRLLDGNNSNQVVLVGFIKLNIVPEVVTPETIVDKETNSIDFGGAAFGCDGWNKNMSWSQVTAWIYQLLNISKADFEDTYELVKNASGDVCQFSKTATGYTQLAAASYYGTVSELTNTTGATTNVINWALTQTDLQRVYEEATGTITIYICYQTKEAPNANPKVYVPMKFGPVTKVEGTIGNKATSAWFRNGSVNLINVPEPSFNNTPTVLAYNYNLNKAWYSGTTTQTLGPVLTDATLAATYSRIKFYLAAGNNETTISDVVYGGNKVSVKLSVDAATCQSLLGGTHNVSAANMGKHALLVSGTPNEYNNVNLYATAGSYTETIATLNQTTGVLTYNTGDLAKALLNHYASGPKNNGDRTEAQLPVVIGICAWNPTCNLALKLTNGQYNGYFLRPINVVSAQGGVFQDAEANGSHIKLTDLLSFSDWRFLDFTGDNIWLYGYYDIQSIDVDINGITSNYAGVWGTNPAVTAGFTHVSQNTGTITWPTPFGPTTSAAAQAQYQTLIDNYYGDIVWTNTGINVSQFNVKIPVTINYAWGKLYTTIEATVKNTYNRK